MIKRKPSKKTNIKWDEKLLVDIYDLALAGNTDEAIAAALKMRLSTFSAWKKKSHPSVAYALEKARKPRTGQKESFEKYVHGRLSPELKELWDELEASDDSPSSIARVEAMLTMGGKRVRQRLFVHAFICHNFILTPALRAVNVDRKTFKFWMREENFRDLMEEINEAKRDFVEAPLLDLVAMGHPGAVIFANKTINQSRGYGTKLEVEHKGQIDHKHTLIDLDKLRLPLDVRIKILEAVDRQAELEEQKKLGVVPEEKVIDAEFSVSEKGKEG